MADNPENLLPLAAVSFPLIALVATFAINSIDDESEDRYRIVVGTFGLLTIVSGAMGATRAFVGVGVGFYFENAVWYTLASFAFAGILTIAVLFQEVLQGIDDTRDSLKIIGPIVAALFLFMAVVWASGL